MNNPVDDNRAPNQRPVNESVVTAPARFKKLGTEHRRIAQAHAKRSCHHGRKLKQFCKQYQQLRVRLSSL